MRLHVVAGVGGEPMTWTGVSSILENADVVHHDGVVSAPVMFAAGRVTESATAALRVDLGDHLIFPGLINAHDHLQLNNIPPLRHAAPFPNSYTWIDGFESHRKEPDVVAATAVPAAVRHWQGALKNVLAGVTTVAHHDPWHAVFDDADFPVRVVREFGWSHSLGLGMTGRGSGGTRYGPPVDASFLATPTDRPWIIHLAEGTDDVARGELASLEEVGCLAANTVLVHGVGLMDRDVERVIETGASVVWCPSSNVGMLGRTLDPARLDSAGRLTLGTDSRLSGSRDLLDELRIAAARGGLSPRELLRLVTERASEVLRLPDCGSLTHGKLADCVIIRVGPEPYETLIGTQRSTIRAVVRGGAPVIADPDFADWFAHCGVATTDVRLDGHPKLLARALARPEVVDLEPGLEIV